GIEPGGPLGRWLNGQALTLEALADISEAQMARIEAVVAQVTTAANAEMEKLAAATRLAVAATQNGELAIRQARNAQIALQVEQVNVTDKMIKETLPLFVEKLQGALVLRERRWNDGVQRRRYAVVGLVTLGLFLGGYVLGAWGDPAATNALVQCLANPLQAKGHLYCDVTSFAQANQ
ncbi:MAG: hypothetical protein J0H57_04410, partial [Rhodospirillales bacterium]|nr:hypothetical protein [Rhodospirillales bacterium]